MPRWISPFSTLNFSPQALWFQSIQKCCYSFCFNCSSASCISNPWVFHGNCCWISLLAHTRPCESSSLHDRASYFRVNGPAYNSAGAQIPHIVYVLFIDQPSIEACLVSSRDPIFSSYMYTIQLCEPFQRPLISTTTVQPAPFWSPLFLTSPPHMGITWLESFVKLKMTPFMYLIFPAPTSRSELAPRIF